MTNPSLAPTVRDEYEDDAALEALEELIEECEEEQEDSEEENYDLDLDDLVSAADLAAMADDEDEDEEQEDDESSSGEQAAGQTDESPPDDALATDAQQEGDEQGEGDSAETTSESSGATGRGSVESIGDVDASLAEVNALLSDIDARRDQLEADWDDGEIEDRDAYKASMRALREEERAANRQERTLDRQRDRLQDEQEQLQVQWKSTVEQFMHANPDYLRSEALQSGLRREIDNLGQDQSWLDKGHEAILYEAMRLIDKEVGRSAPAAKQEKEQEQDKPLDELSGRRAAMKGRGKRPNAPQTLGGLPAAEEAPIQNDEFSALDRLTGDAREEAMGRMSPDKMQQYLSQASL